MQLVFVAETPFKDYRRMIVSLQKKQMVPSVLWHIINSQHLEARGRQISEFQVSQGVGKVLLPPPHKNPDGAINNLLSACMCQFSKLCGRCFEIGFHCCSSSVYLNSRSFCLSFSQILEFTARGHHTQCSFETGKEGRVALFDFFLSFSISLFTSD